MRINNDRSLNSPKPSSDDRDQTFINPYMTKKKKRARRVSASESEPILVVVCQRQDHYQQSRFIPLRSTPSYFAFRRLKCKGSESWSERSVCEPGASNNLSWFVQMKRLEKLNKSAGAISPPIKTVSWFRLRLFLIEWRSGFSSSLGGMKC